LVFSIAAIARCCAMPTQIADIPHKPSLNATKTAAFTTLILLIAMQQSPN
jgi:hypothetical protein